MNRHDLGFAQIFITDRNFGSVGVQDESFSDRFQKTFQIYPKRFIWQDQEHTCDIAWVSGDSPDFFPHTDGLMSDQGEVLLIMKSADCVPILLWNEEERIVAVLHCGWKGFFRGILESFQMLCSKKNLNASYFRVFVGPHLRVNSFDVEDDFIVQIPAKKIQFLQDRDGKKYYNLTQGVLHVLQSFGITDIHDCGINTYTHPDYFSYRKWLRDNSSSRSVHYQTFSSSILISHDVLH